jgi:hypothetical protein
VKNDGHLTDLELILPPHKSRGHCFPSMAELHPAEGDQETIYKQRIRVFGQP